MAVNGLRKIREFHACLSRKSGKSGQSVIEFVLMLPLMIGLSVLLYRINSAIQMSIVNQQYARAQTLFLAFNSPYYPEKRYRTFGNRLTMGVSENNAGSGDDTQYVPEASVQMIARTPQEAGRQPAAQEEPTETGYVRIRNTVSICTQSSFIDGGGALVPPSVDNFNEQFQTAQFAYCRSVVE